MLMYMVAVHIETEPSVLTSSDAGWSGDKAASVNAVYIHVFLGVCAGHSSMPLG